MNETANNAAAAGLSLAVVAFICLIGLALYVFTCFCFKRICEKCKVDPGVMIWIPIVQLIPPAASGGDGDLNVDFIFRPVRELRHRHNDVGEDLLRPG